ncbi:hypothetical protein [uncultured Paludibaculum sp.]|uniref:hypothetical protein n=1 Tax=uncultured Paludibaculum sp. TaxID=1765020 RepID=UPI002AAC36BE|nr:hypothetical protein [uncultured Paludibaculum sp.]
MASDLHPRPIAPLPLQDERWALLHRVAASSAFQKSNRCRELLLFVGERSLRDPNHVIREHEIGVSVFGRPVSYDTSQDTLVRVQISQLRKKIQQYFAEEGKDETLGLELPKGSYSIVFHPRLAEAEQDALDHPARPPWRTYALLGVTVALAAACLVLGLQNRELSHRAQLGLGNKPLVDEFWKQMFQNGLHSYLVLADGNLLVFEDQIKHQISVQEYESKAFERMATRAIENEDLRRLTLNVVYRRFTGIADASLATRMGLVGASNGLSLDVVLARDVSMPQVSTHNTILLGSRRANPWVGLFEEKLNFRTVFEESPKVAYFQNVSPKAGELAEYRGQWSTLSYCRVAYLPNPKGNGSVLLISGTDVQATEAGGEFVTNEIWVRTFRNAMGLQPGEPVPHFEFLLEGKMVVNTVPQFRVIAWRRH